MKNYLIFTGEHYYSEGGMDDFLCDEEILSVAKGKAKALVPNIYDRWAHIYSITDSKIVWRYGTSLYGKWRERQDKNKG